MKRNRGHWRTYFLIASAVILAILALTGNPAANRSASLLPVILIIISAVLSITSSQLELSTRISEIEGQLQTLIRVVHRNLKNNGQESEELVALFTTKEKSGNAYNKTHDTDAKK